MTLIIRRTVAAAFGGSLVALLSSPVALGQTPAYSLRNTLYSTTKADGPQGARAGYDSQDNAVGSTQQGAAAAFKALPLSQAVAQKWDFLGPTTGSVVGLATFTGRPTVVSGRITGLAISPSCNADSCPLFVAAADVAACESVAAAVAAADDAPVDERGARLKSTSRSPTLRWNSLHCSDDLTSSMICSKSS